MPIILVDQKYQQVVLALLNLHPNLIVEPQTSLLVVLFLAGNLLVDKSWSFSTGHREGDSLRARALRMQHSQ